VTVRSSRDFYKSGIRLLSNAGRTTTLCSLWNLRRWNCLSGASVSANECWCQPSSFSGDRRRLFIDVFNALCL